MFKDASDRRLDASRSFLHIMAGNQKAQIEAIDNLIRKSQLRHFAFEREHSLVNINNTLTTRISPARVSERLQCFAKDLCSVLDHLRNLRTETQRAPQNQNEAEELNNTLYHLRDHTVQGRWRPDAENPNVLGYFITLRVGREALKLLIIVPKLLNFVIDTRNTRLTPKYNRETVRKGLNQNDGVHIPKMYISWNAFDVICGIYNEDDSKLWTVSTL